MHQQSELEVKFYEVKASEKSFVVVPTESERRLLQFVRMANKPCETFEDVEAREKYLGNLTVKEVAEIRVLTNEINAAWERKSGEWTQLPMMSVEEERKNG